MSHFNRELQGFVFWFVWPVLSTKNVKWIPASLNTIRGELDSPLPSLTALSLSLVFFNRLNSFLPWALALANILLTPGKFLLQLCSGVWAYMPSRQKGPLVSEALSIRPHGFYPHDTYGWCSLFMICVLQYFIVSGSAVLHSSTLNIWQVWCMDEINLRLSASIPVPTS